MSGQSVMVAMRATTVAAVALLVFTFSWAADQAGGILQPQMKPTKGTYQEPAEAIGKKRIAAGRIEAGTVAAQRMIVSGLRNGRTVLQMRPTWYCTTELDPAWDLRPTGWHISVDGDAPLDIDMLFPVSLEEMGAVSPGYTANRAVNAVPYVCAAAPGIRTSVDLPQIIANLGSA